MKHQIYLIVSLVICRLSSVQGAPVVPLTPTTRVTLLSTNGFSTSSQKTSTTSLRSTGRMLSNVASSTTFKHSGTTSVPFRSNVITAGLSTSTPKTSTFSVSKVETSTVSKTTQQASTLSTSRPKTPTSYTSTARKSTFSTSTYRTSTFSTSILRTSVVSISTPRISKFSTSAPRTSTLSKSTLATSTFVPSTISTSTPTRSSGFSSSALTTKSPTSTPTTRLSTPTTTSASSISTQTSAFSPSTPVITDGFTSTPTTAGLSATTNSPQTQSSLSYLLGIATSSSHQTTLSNDSNAITSAYSAPLSATERASGSTAVPIGMFSGVQEIPQNSGNIGHLTTLSAFDEVKGMVNIYLPKPTGKSTQTENEILKVNGEDTKEVSVAQSTSGPQVFEIAKPNDTQITSNNINQEVDIFPVVTKSKVTEKLGGTQTNTDIAPWIVETVSTNSESSTTSSTLRTFDSESTTKEFKINSDIADNANYSMNSTTDRYIEKTMVQMVPNTTALVTKPKTEETTFDSKETVLDETSFVTKQMYNGVIPTNTTRTPSTSSTTSVMTTAPQGHIKQTTGLSNADSQEHDTSTITVTNGDLTALPDIYNLLYIRGTPVFSRLLPVNAPAPKEAPKDLSVVASTTDMSTGGTFDDVNGMLNTNSPKPILQTSFTEDELFKLKSDDTKEDLVDQSTSGPAVFEITKPTVTQVTSTNMYQAVEIVPVVTKTKMTEKLDGSQTYFDLAPGTVENVLVHTDSSTTPSIMRTFDSESTKKEFKFNSPISDNANYTMNSSTYRYIEKRTEQMIPKTTTKVTKSTTDMSTGDALITTANSELPSTGKPDTTPTPAAMTWTSTTRSVASSASLRSILGFSTTTSDKTSGTPPAQKGSTTGSHSHQVTTSAINDRFIPIMAISLIERPDNVYVPKSTYATSSATASFTSRASSSTLSSSKEDHGNNTQINGSVVTISALNGTENNSTALNGTEGNFISSNKTTVTIKALNETTGHQLTENGISSTKGPTRATSTRDGTAGSSKAVHETSDSAQTKNGATSQVPAKGVSSSDQMETTRNVSTTEPFVSATKQLIVYTINGIDVNLLLRGGNPPRNTLRLTVPLSTKTTDIRSHLVTSSPAPSTNTAGLNTPSAQSLAQVTPTTLDVLKGMLNTNSTRPILQSFTEDEIFKLKSDAMKDALLVQSTSGLPAFEIAKPTDERVASTTINQVVDIFPEVSKQKITDKLDGSQKNIDLTPWITETSSILSDSSTTSETLRILDSENTTKEFKTNSAIADNASYSMKPITDRYIEKATEQMVPSTTTLIVKEHSKDPMVNSKQSALDETSFVYNQTVTSSILKNTTPTTASSTTTPMSMGSDQHTDPADHTKKTMRSSGADDPSEPPIDYYFYDASRAAHAGGTGLFSLIGLFLFVGALLV